jgi:hypothetical protein
MPNVCDVSINASVNSNSLYKYSIGILLCPRGKGSLNPLDGRLGGLQSRSVRCGEEKNLGHVGSRTPAIQPVARYTDSAMPIPM